MVGALLKHFQTVTKMAKKKSSGDVSTIENKNVGIPMYVFLVAYVALSTGVPVWWHWNAHGVVSTIQISLAFFLGLNAIVCIWEMCLFFEINLIETKHKIYSDQYKGRALDIALKFFCFDVNLGNVLTSKLWAEVFSSFYININIWQF